MIQKTSTLTTVGGIMGAFGLSLAGMPLVVLQYYAQVVKNGAPPWFDKCVLPMMLIGLLMSALGTAIVGIAAKGADEHSTPGQIEAAQQKAEVAQVALDADAAAKPAIPSKVIVEPKP